jgi:hypothetical protein
MLRLAGKPTESSTLPYILREGHMMWPQVADLYGGRGRTRTCDLLRVKQAL